MPPERSTKRLLHGRSAEDRFNVALQSWGVEVELPTEQGDLFGALDAIVTGYRTGEVHPYRSCGGKRRRLERLIHLQYTLKIDDAEKLRRFVRIAKRRGGKHLYIMFDASSEPEHWIFNDPNFTILGYMLREVILSMIRSCRERDVVWVVILKSRTGYLYSVDEWEEKYECEVQTPERVITRIEERLERRLGSATRRHGEIKWVNRTGGRIKVYDPNGTGQYLMFDRDAVRDPKLQQAIATLLRLGYGRELNGLKISFEVQNTSDGFVARAVLANDPEKIEALKKLIWEKTVVETGRLDAALKTRPELRELHSNNANP